MRRSRHGVLPVALGLVLAASLGACSRDVAAPVEIPGADASTGTSAPAPSAPATSGADDPTPTAPTAPTTPAGEGEVVVVAERPVVAPDLPAYELEVRPLAGADAEQQAVLAAWRDFWVVLTTASGVPAWDPAAVGAVATGQARTDVETYVRGLEEQERRVTGRLVVVADVVTVDGTTAVVDGCSDALDGEVGADGVPVELPAGATGLRTELVQEGPTWRVQQWGVQEGLC